MTDPQEPEPDLDSLTRAHGSAEPRSAQPNLFVDLFIRAGAIQMAMFGDVVAGNNVRSIEHYRQRLFGD